MRGPILVAINPATMPVTDERDGPEAKALVVRVEAIKKHAHAHLHDQDTMPWPGEDPERRFTLEVGDLTCVYFRSIAGGKLGRCLFIGMKTAKTTADLPPPMACAVIAKMFGFIGEAGVDYRMDVETCACPRDCPPIVRCTQREFS